MRYLFMASFVAAALFGWAAVGRADTPAEEILAGAIKAHGGEEAQTKFKAGQTKAKGKIELIPGPAFNLLEVNLTIEPRPGKVQQANFLLVKK